jgi:murein DD-endopeptidase MepM/ murein hydrolase activator NlpD
MIALAAFAPWAPWVGPEPKPGYPLASGTITQGFDVPWSVNPQQRHTGLDIAAKRGTAVWVMKSGTIVNTGSLGGEWGNYIVVQEDAGTVSGYLHLELLPYTKIGQRVTARTPLAKVFKDHLHINSCLQVAGCQHGAFPNPTFGRGTVGMYYRRPPLNY